MSFTATETQLGDPGAFAELYGEFHPRVMGVCQRMLGSEEEAEDASSEVFVRLPRTMKTYNSALPFPPWLSRVASNYCVDLLRRRRSEQRFLMRADPHVPEPAAPVMSPFEELLSAEHRNAVRAAIARLPERYFVPLVMRYYSELSYKEIAQTLGLTRAHVATLISRAKQELRRVLIIQGIGSPMDAGGSAAVPT